MMLLAAKFDTNVRFLFDRGPQADNMYKFLQTESKKS